MQKFSIGILVAAVLLAGSTPALTGDEPQRLAALTATKAKTVQFDRLAGFNSAQTRIANKITRRFAEAGYGPAQQIAAVSVAIRESTLNPGATTAVAIATAFFR